MYFLSRLLNYNGCLLCINRVYDRFVYRHLCLILYRLRIRSHNELQNRSFHEMMWKNVVDRGRPQTTIRRSALHAGLLRLRTHTGYEILIGFPLQQWLHERASMLRYLYIACIMIWPRCCPVTLARAITRPYHENWFSFLAVPSKPSCKEHHN
jgi:hypothetical protein